MSEEPRNQCSKRGLLHTPNWEGGPSMKNQTPGQSHTPHHSSILVMRLSQQEINEKREKGLCFYCDERYVAGHKCQAQRALRLEVASKMEENVE